MFEDLAIPVELEDAARMREINGVVGTACALNMAFDGIQFAGRRDDGGNLVLCKADGCDAD